MTILSALLWVLILLAVPVIVLGWITASDTERARELRRLGWSQQRIADRLGVSRYRVRKMLAQGV
jgi:DNA-directed RNA polymerase subunit N (RpoN/RPB10)